jgi:single-strand DNA-binding protein
MSSLNRVTLIGNVGKDPEIRNTQGGQKVATFSVATTETWKDRSGEKKESTDWHNVVVWNEGLVGVIERFVKKGTKLLVEGKLKTRKWTDQQGQDRYTTEVVLQFDAKLLLLGGRESQGGDAYDPGDAGYGGGQRGGNQRSGGGYAADRGGRGGGSGGGRPAPATDAIDDDLIPF